MENSVQSKEIFDQQSIESVQKIEGDNGMFDTETRRLLKKVS